MTLDSDCETSLGRMRTVREMHYWRDFFLFCVLIFGVLAGEAKMSYVQVCTCTCLNRPRGIVGSSFMRRRFIHRQSS